MVFNNRAALLVAGILLATSACGGNNAVPSGAGSTNAALQLSMSQAGGASPVDTTSILKKLRVDVAIGSTVDPTNGDTGPHALGVVRATYILSKGQLVVCNFADSGGNAGKGTTVEVLNPTPGSSPTRFTQSSDILGCTGDALSSGNDVFGAGLDSGIDEKFNQKGKAVKTYGSPLVAPFNDADAFCNEPYAPEAMYVADASTGSIVKFADGIYGNPNEVAVVTGFDVNKGTGWGVLGPSGLQYNATKHGSRCNDTLYAVDGVDNTVVAISNSANLLVKGEIAVQPGGKTFKCLHPKATCATLVYSGSPLNAPYAATLLPNGNLIVANTQGGNKLVELTPAGQILDVKAVDKSLIPHVFGLVAVGSTDLNTVLYYTTTKDNSVHELKR